MHLWVLFLQVGRYICEEFPHWHKGCVYSDGVYSHIDVVVSIVVVLLIGWVDPLSVHKIPILVASLGQSNSGSVGSGRSIDYGEQLVSLLPSIEGSSNLHQIRLSLQIESEMHSDDILLMGRNE
jgi:hypothetical protein